MKAQNVTILGLNRTGLSVGLALKQSSAALEITGYDENREVLNQAQKMGAVDKTQWKIINAVAEADIIVVSVTATQLEQTLRVIGQDLQAQNQGYNQYLGLLGAQMGLGQQMTGIGQQQYQAGLNPLNAYASVLNPFTGLNTTQTQSQPSTGGGLGGALGGALTMEQLLRLFNGG